jgi:signal transduction histidine kinase
VETGVYRIAREALENAGRHAAAGTVSVHLATTPVSVTLTVSDDGRGFDSAVPADRFGLQGMTERARLLGGVLHVETEPGTGTRIVAEIPLGDPR